MISRIQQDLDRRWGELEGRWWDADREGETLAAKLDALEREAGANPAREAELSHALSEIWRRQDALMAQMDVVLREMAALAVTRRPSTEAA
jgi:hypothetical protein